MGETADRDGHKVVLPRFLHLCTVCPLQYPWATAVVLLIEFAGAFVLFGYTGLPSRYANAALLVLSAVATLLALRASVSMWFSGILGDLVDFVGESGCRDCFARANVEVRAGIFPSLMCTVLPVVCYFTEIRGNERTRDITELEHGLIYAVTGILTVLGSFVGCTFSGLATLMRVLATLLKAALHKHFTNLEEALLCEGLSTEQRIKELDERCKHVKRVFEKANRVVTRLVLLAVVLSYLAGLITVLEAVVEVRANVHTTFMLVYFAGVCATTTTCSTIVLQSMTSVADYFEDRASNLSFDIKLRFRLTSTFTGPAGVKLLCSFENDHVNDLSFNFHHRPMDARVLEGTLVRLASGALVTICLGILT